MYSIKDTMNPIQFWSWHVLRLFLPKQVWTPHSGCYRNILLVYFLLLLLLPSECKNHLTPSAESHLSCVKPHSRPVVVDVVVCFCSCLALHRCPPSPACAFPPRPPVPMATSRAEAEAVARRKACRAGWARRLVGGPREEGGVVVVGDVFFLSVSHLKSDLQEVSPYKFCSLAL